jgi:hypothetical protein
MNHDLICSWLGLPPGEWPPDHYRLLGLEPGEGDPQRIEQRVHQRLDAVRRYQMMHPEQATEAMNRLAQAYVCLSDPASKRAYDAALLGSSAVAVAEAEPSAGAAPPEPRDPLAWLYSGALTDTAVLVPVLPATPALPSPPPPGLPAPAAEAEPTQPPVPAVTLPPTPPPAPEPTDPALEAARSAPARRGLGTKRALYHRIARTRQLLDVWHRLGKYVANPKRRLARQAEADELVFLMEEVQTLLQDFPPLMGEAGQPGYMVIALSQLDQTIKSFQTLSPSQRESLSRDWQSGQKLLQAHRDFLREEIRAMRKRGPADRLVRATRWFLNDHPGALLLLLGLLALNIAIWRTSFQALWKGHSPPPVVQPAPEPEPPK